jgi:hypothetical protein
MSFGIAPESARPSPVCLKVRPKFKKKYNDMGTAIMDSNNHVKLGLKTFINLTFLRLTLLNDTYETTAAVNVSKKNK